MKTIRRFIYREVVMGVAFVTLAFLALFFFFDMVDALRWVGRAGANGYQLSHALLFVALSLPLTQRVEALGLAKDNNARIIVLITFFTLFGWPAFSRVVRSQVLSLRERDFVMAARSQGASTSRIVFKELLPNLWSPVIVFLSLSLPGYLSSEAVFSFLGVGVQAPASTWGLVLADAINYWSQDPVYLLIPAGMLVIVVLALNVLGDAVRDALDPKADR